MFCNLQEVGAKGKVRIYSPLTLDVQKFVLNILSFELDHDEI